MRGATLFSGGGGVEARLKDCVEFVHAVEYDPAIAAVYRANHGDHIQVADVCDVDYTAWGTLDYGHASPVCKEFSQAKAGGAEGDTDIQSALAVVRFLEACTPRVFTLENVGGYVRSQSYRLICQALDHAGYMWHAEVLNSADYGVPQTRRRLILRAVRDALLPGLPAPLPWVGWYAAIKDLIPTLPASQFAAWQLARLPEEMGNYLCAAGNMNNEIAHRSCDLPAWTVTSHAQGSARAFIVHANDQRSMPVRDADAPMFTVAAASHNTHAPDTKPKAFIVGGGNTNKAVIDSTYRNADEPFYTVASGNGYIQARAFLVDGQTNSESTGVTIRDCDAPSFTVAASATHRPARAWLSQGRVVKMTPRALARFQSLPDDFVLPEKSSLACTVIGNVVPSLLMREIVRPLL